MVHVVIVGSVGLDDVKTPFGDVKGVLGGSATYASYASSFFAPTGLVAVVGEDLPGEHITILKNKGIDLSGIHRQGKNFRWSGYYEYDMNEAKTITTELNSLATFKPILPESYCAAPFLFLANLDPDSQLDVMSQVKRPKLVVMDTMNYWITSKKERLIEAIQGVDVLLVNDGEARQLFGTSNLIQAGKKALALGPKACVIKKGEHGALLFTHNSIFSASGYPLEIIKDPTGCGDCFGGGFVGFLAKTADLSEKNMRRAVVYGSTIASFNAEDFSFERLKHVTLQDIEGRFKEFKDIREF
ncbi:sugar kinase [Candidatus Woesearchaeota archaeon]|nr:sugar kinase [Candidatus Woesearchaeota archaeon]